LQIYLKCDYVFFFLKIICYTINKILKVYIYQDIQGKRFDLKVTNLSQIYLDLIVRLKQIKI